MRGRSDGQKNMILLGDHYRSGQLESDIGRFVKNFIHDRCHENLDRLTPTDAYYGQGTKILKIRRKIKQRTMSDRQRLHL